MTQTGQASSTDDFYAVPVEIQTDPIDDHRNGRGKINFNIEFFVKLPTKDTCLMSFIQMSRPNIMPILARYTILPSRPVPKLIYSNSNKLIPISKSYIFSCFRMILIILAACFWGVTNPFLKNGALGYVYPVYIKS